MRLLISALALTFTAHLAAAATIPIIQNPLTTAGFDATDNIRQVAGANAINVAAFDTAADVFALDLAAFGLSGPLTFVNALAGNLPATGVNMIVLQNADNDNNAATPFNAGVAANLIALATSDDGAGFFVYFNSVLNINRLVFSTNLNQSTADLAILAAIQNPAGAQAIATLPTFRAGSFVPVAAVPLPASLPLLVAGLVGLGMVRRKSRH